MADAMDTGEINPQAGLQSPDLGNSPYTYHYCIVSCKDDVATCITIQERLDRDGFNGYPGSEQDGSLAIDKIQKSKKLVILVTALYRKSTSLAHHMELLEVARKKAECLTKGHVIVLQGVSDDDIKNIHLDSYSSIRFDPSDVNQLDLAARIRDDPILRPALKPNIGAAFAIAHYYGYFIHILPEFHTKVEEYRRIHNIDKINLKFMVIVPESLDGPPSLEMFDKERITKTNGRIRLIKQRAGKERDYSSQVYKITSGDEEYLFAGEVPAVLLNIYELEKDRLDNKMPVMTSEEKRWTLEQFCYHMHCLIQTNDDCKDKVSFIFHADKETCGGQQIGDVILDRIRRDIKLTTEHAE